ncbi:MAG TPA: glutathione S-transferase family protein [Micropepsaceae bacterium]|jgi:glutathione S-transferase|nr:glutathione S-transferase family protein [Micropepsaceae bacterium]
MRRLTHLLLSPASRLVRLMLGEKRIACDLAGADDPLTHLPVLRELDGSLIVGLWAIIDHLENEHPERPLLPGDALERGEALRLFDWAMSNFHEEATKRIVFEKGSQTQTGSLNRRPPNMETVRAGRQALATALPALGTLAETRGFLAGRDVSLADLAVAAHLSALDYFGEVPWAEQLALTEWYTRMKSRPSFRPLLNDRVPGQPPVSHYAELDF